MKANRTLIWITFSIPSFFLGIYLVKITGYGDDQYEYYQYVQNLSIWDYSLLETIIGIKYRVMYVLSPSVAIFGASLITATFINYILLTYILSKIFRGRYLVIVYYCSVLLIPSIYIHAVTFLREIFVYIVASLFFYNFATKNGHSSLSVIIITFSLVAIIRIDNAVLITPLLIHSSRLNKNTKYIAYLSNFIITYFLISYQNDMFNNYRTLFGMGEVPIHHQIFNFYLPTKGSLAASIMSFWECMVIMLIWLTIAYYRQLHHLIMPYFFMQAIGILLLGDVSDNIGFTTRIRSIILFSMVISLFTHVLLSKNVSVRNRA